MKRFFLVFCSVACSLFLCFAQPVRELPKKGGYVASTSWVASIAELSGIEDVVVIAPSYLRHPPEYEISPEDVYTISEADLFMYAGYERMMQTLSNASELDKEKIIKVKTTNTLANLRNMVEMLSYRAGTEEEAQKRFEKYERLIYEARERIAKSSDSNIPVYVNKDQAEFAVDLGLNVVSVFGGGQLTPDRLAEAAEKKYPLVIDNVHNPQSAAIADVSPDSKILMFRNFSDFTGNNALYNVVSNNLELLWDTGLF